MLSQICCYYNFSYNVIEEITTLSNVDNCDEINFVIARQGCLLARIPMHNQLSSDFPAGKLILQNSIKVLLAKITNSHNSKEKVYEVSMVLNGNYGVDGRGREYMYISLSPQFVSDHSLTNGSKIKVEIQFEMNRLPICKMHYAVDRLDKSGNIHKIFPKTYPQKAEPSKRSHVEYVHFYT